MGEGGLQIDSEKQIGHLKSWKLVGKALQMGKSMNLKTQGSMLVVITSR